MCLIAIEEGDLKAVSHYASLFIKACSTLNLGERQRMAATVNNQFKYYRNEDADRRRQEVSERRRQWIAVLSLSFALVIAVMIGLYYYTSLRFYRRLIQSNQELGIARELLKKTTKQSQSFFRLIGKVKMDETAAEVIANLHTAAAGTYCMQPEDWQKLYQAVEILHPEFKDVVIRTAEEVTEVQFKVFCLVYAGFSDTEIRNITNISKTTLWRMTSKFRKAISESDVYTTEIHTPSNS